MKETSRNEHLNECRVEEEPSSDVVTVADEARRAVDKETGGLEWKPLVRVEESAVQRWHSKAQALLERRRTRGTGIRLWYSSRAGDECDEEL